MRLEVISRNPEGTPKPTPILFVHGAWHAAWCWDEFFLPYFAAKGYAVHALSLRGHGKSESDKGTRWRSAADYVADVEQVVAGITPSPILIGHSMGGYVVQKYLESHTAPAGVLVASIPSCGTLPFLLRETLHFPLTMLRVSLTMLTYPMVDTPEKVQRSFFSADMPQDRVRAYAARMENESFRVALDSSLLATPRPSKVKTPLLVLGAANDAVFTVKEVEATARAYNTQATIFPNMAHDMMLEAGWQSVADTILTWLDSR